MSHSLRALRIFGSVARHGSISKAAAELGITQSAVSHQLSRLSHDMGERLILKSGRGIVFTETGQLLADRLNAAFTEVENAVAEALGGTDRRTVRLLGYMGFLSGWVIPRLPEFRSTHPNIDLQLVMAAQDDDMSSGVADVFVTWSRYQKGFWSTRLMRENLIAVASGAGNGDRNVFGTLPLITCELDPEQFASDWIAFSQVSGLPLEVLHTGQWLQCSHFVLAIDIARRGLGIALVPDFIVADDLDSGALKRIGSYGVATARDYYLCLKSARRHEPALRAVVSWLKKQIVDG